MSDWRDRARCIDDWDQFYPDGDTEQAHLTILPAAKAICDTCPVAKACLATAMDPDNPQKHGIWAGKTPGQREALRKSTPPTKPTCPECRREFSNKSALRFHERTHNTHCVNGHRRNGKSNCPDCKRSKDAIRPPRKKGAAA